ncbi:hypothetical protein [Fusibacter bizertensis]
MRISQNNIVQNTINFVKNQSNIDLKAMVGSVLQGHISGIPQNQTALFVSGDQQLLVNIGEAKLTDQQALTLKIIDFKEGALIANILSDNVGNSSGTNSAEVLSKLGVLVNAENAEIIETMKASNVPITKDNFQAVRQSLIEVKALMGELKQEASLDFSKELSTPIKALVLKLIQQNSSVSNSNLNTSTTVETSKDVTGQRPSMGINLENGSNKPEVGSDKLSLNQSEVLKGKSEILNIQDSNLKNQSQDNISESKINLGVQNNGKTHLNEHSMELNSRQLLDAIVQKFSEDGKSTEAIKNLMEKFDLNTDILHLKNEIPVTIKSVFVANEQLNNKDIVVQRFESILNHINVLKLDKQTVVELLEIFKNEVSDADKIAKLSEVISNKVPKSESKSKLEQELALLKEHSTLTKPLIDQVVYMPVNIPQGNNEQRVSLYYKKKQKNTNFEDFTLLVALNTQTCGEVRCIVHKLKNQVSLSFSFENEITKRTFEDSKVQLAEALSSFDQYQFSLSFNVRETLSLEIDDFDELEAGFGFDIKV